MQKTQIAMSELMYHLLEQSSDCSFIIDIQTSEIIYCNYASSKLIGTTKDKIYNQKASHILSFYKEYEHWHTNIDFEQSDCSFRDENIIISANDEIIPIEINSKIIKNNDSYYQLLTFCIISYKKKLVEQYLVNEEFYKLLIENSPECFYLLDADGNFIYANESTLKSLGYDLSELLNLKYTDIVAPEEINEYYKNFDKLVKDNAKVIKTKGKLISKDGSYKIFDFTAINLLKQPKARGILVIGHNITALTEYDSKLSKINKTYQNIINNIPFPMYISDWDSKILFANEIYAHNMNRDLDQCVGKTYQELGFDQELVQQHITEERQLLIEFKGTSPRKSDYTNPYTGEVDTYLIKKVPIIYYDQTAILCIAIDVTELQRTKDLLIKNNNELEKVNQELDRFIYAASHELRSPVTTIQGLINLVRGEENIECIMEYITLIAENVKRQDKIIKNLISFTKNKELEVLIKPINFSILVRNVLQNLSHHRNYKIVKITKNISQEFPFLSDPVRIELILKNILSNSLKYIKSNSQQPYIEINIRTEVKSAVIEIVDNGIGIEADKQDKVFNMLYRATNKEYGTGLGLYITKDAVKKINGEITLTSALDLGTKMTIHLPNLENALVSE